MKHPLSIALLAALLAGLAQAQNDDCATPDIIAGQGTFPYDNSLATTGIEGQNEANCYAFGTSAIYQDIWFEWTADLTGVAVIDTCGASADTRIAAYPAGGCPLDGTSLTCNDDNCGLQSQVSFSVVNGTSYLLQVGNFGVGQGSFENLNIAIAIPPANDDCSTPTAISGQGLFSYNNAAASTGAEGQLESLCYAFGSTGIDNDIWFEWTADATGTARVDTCGSTSDTKLAAYPAGGCPADGTAIACNDDFCGLQSTILFPCVSGSTYLIQAGNFPGATGGATDMNILIGNAPSNDDCSNAIDISGMTSMAFDTSFASGGGGLGASCNSGAASSDIFFTYTPATSDDYVWSICGASYDVVLSVLDACGGTELGCDDGFATGIGACAGTVNDVTVFTPGLIAGTTYVIQVDGWGGAQGTGQLDIGTYTPPPGDDCSAPDPIAGQGVFPYDNTLASTGAEGQNEAICYAFGTSASNQDLWFDWTADATGMATIQTCGSAPDTRLTAYPSGMCPTQDSSLACNDDTCGLQSEIMFPVAGGQTYLIQAGNFAAGQGGPSDLIISIDSTGFGPGTNVCTSTVNSTGQASMMSATGSASIAANDVVISADSLPTQPGIFIAGPTETQIPFFNGFLCVSPTGLQRFNTIDIPSSGVVSTIVDIATSAPGGLNVVAGSPYYFQRWNRDPAAGGGNANFSDAYEIVYTP